MNTIVFVDEKAYRFSHYYEDIEWWRARGVRQRCFDYEKRINKYLVYAYVLLFRPRAVVCVQLSTKNLILMRLANLVGVTTIFWQHGIFEYPIKVPNWLSKLRIRLDKLYALSAYDLHGIVKNFYVVRGAKVIDHYDLPKYKFKNTQYSGLQTKIAYIGQVMMPKQVSESGASVMEKYLGDVDVFKEFLDLIDSTDKKINVLIKRHPGDHSRYIDEIVEKYSFVREADTAEIMQADMAISYDSTLLIAYKALGKTIVQLPMANGQFRFDFGPYPGDGVVRRADRGDAVVSVIEELERAPQIDTNVGPFQTISEVLYEGLLL